MGNDQDETEWELAFRQRLKLVRGNRRHEDMAKVLCISRDAWNKYENRNSRAVPIWLLPKIASMAGKSLEWLIEGDKTMKKKAQKPRPKVASSR